MSPVLVAGMGNVLRRDDGFGVEVARRLASDTSLPAAVRVIDVGIGGIHLVQELMAGYDALVVIDAVERGSAPGTVHLLTAEVPDLAEWSDIERGDFLADTHYTSPAKAMILAKALGTLPPRVFILGCQPADAADLGIGLSEVVERAVAQAVEVLVSLVANVERELAQRLAPAAPAGGADG
jgi:hydrogenase maturation protease